MGLSDQCHHLWPSPPLHSPPSNRGSHALPLLPKTGGLQHWGYCHGGKLRQRTLKDFCLRICLLQTPEHRHHQAAPAPELPQASAPHPAPGLPLPSTYFRREPTPGAVGGGQGPVASPPAAEHPAPSAPSSSGTPGTPSPSHLGLCCTVSGSRSPCPAGTRETPGWGGRPADSARTLRPLHFCFWLPHTKYLA